MNLDALSTNNPFLTVMIGNFNAKSSNWYLNYITSFQGSEIEFLASQSVMSSVINEPGPYFRQLEVLHRSNTHITT